MRQKHIRLAAQASLIAAAREEDAAMLRTAISNENEFVRAAAASALGQALGEAADEDLQSLASDESDRVRMAAARAMANYGQRDALPSMIALLNSDDVEVRTQSSSTLRSLTDQFFSYAAYDAADKRQTAIAKWDKWLSEDGKTAKLHFSLEAMGLWGQLPQRQHASGLWQPPQGSRIGSLRQRDLEPQDQRRVERRKDGQWQWC